MPLADKQVIVTGASRGIGAATAVALGAAGASVVLAARDGRLAATVAAQIVAMGGEAEAVACDVSDGAAVAQLIADARRRFGPSTP